MKNHAKELKPRKKKDKLAKETRKRNEKTNQNHLPLKSHVKEPKPKRRRILAKETRKRNEKTTKNHLPS